MNLMTLRQYARHRGCSLSSVQAAVDEGRIAIAKEETHGKQVWKFVDADAADIAWANTTDPTQQRNPTRRDLGIEHTASRTPQPLPRADGVQQSLFSAPDEDEDEVTSSPSELKSGSKQSEYFAHRAIKEEYQAKTAELDYLERAGNLIDIDKVRIAFFNIGNLVQQSLLNIPVRVSGKILSEAQAYIGALKQSGPESDPPTFDDKVIQDVISAEIKLVLQDLANAKFA